MTLIEQFDRDIQGEKLLYENKDSYTKEESKLIVETIARRISKNYYYASLISRFQPVLRDKVWPNLQECELFVEKDAIGYEFARIKKLSISYAEEERDFAHYNAKLDAGIISSKSYFSTIKNSRISGQMLDNVLEDQVFSFLYDADTDFLITANMMFKRYPEYYNEEKVLSLYGIIFMKDKKCMSKEELKEYKVAEKQALNNIKKFKKKTKKENKAKRKVWKENNK